MVCPIITSAVIHTSARNLPVLSLPSASWLTFPEVTWLSEAEGLSGVMEVCQRPGNNTGGVEAPKGRV